MQIWDQPTRKDASQYLLLRHQVRKRVGFQGLCTLVREAYAEWEPEKIWIEGEKLGEAVRDSLKNELPIECVPTRGRCKVTRAGPLTVKMERGEVFFPSRNTTWMPTLEAEMLTWTGDERQTSDQIDAAAYAVIVTGRKTARTIRVERGAVG
jgi:predicted phage terminase large subunit-like protein